MTNQNYTVIDAPKEHFKEVGELMVSVYANLDGFPKPDEQPNYYNKLLNVGDFTKQPTTRLLVAISENQDIAGAVVYFSDMKHYGSGGTVPQEKHAAGFRLLAVHQNARGKGIGKLLSKACIDIAKQEQQKQLIIHSTKAMQIAWSMYEKLGFKRAPEFDFKQDDLQVFGFRLEL